MANRIEVSSTVPDTRSNVRKQWLESRFPLKNIEVVLIDVYTIDKEIPVAKLTQFAKALTSPVTQNYQIVSSATRKLPWDKKFTWAIEYGFLPGVTDNIAHTTTEMLQDGLRLTFENGEHVYSSQLLFISGNVSSKQIQTIAEGLINPLIQRVSIKSYQQYKKDRGMDIVVPKVVLRPASHSERSEESSKLDPSASSQDDKEKGFSVKEVSLSVSDEELIKIGKEGIINDDGTRRGPLALDLIYMKTIQEYFKKLGRKPTDIELESLAQTWSEHCKHTILADPIDEIKDGLYKTYIKGATEKIRKAKGAKDFCVSVFTDNSGAIEFDDKWLITHKVETHNSPSALDPFGGAITGIIGVNRDAIGFGMGAKPVANTYGFCFADPADEKPLYRDKKRQQKMLSPRRIMEGVIAGVNSGGNCSGIPTPQGFLAFDQRYKGKPLVFVGTVGLIPRTVNGKPSYKKKAEPNDYIVMIGGKVGLDGIHGATFSSVALDSSSPVSAVQIGDPITQKKFSDGLVKEARDLGLYNSITDNGAGGLSCSVAEMARESGGCLVALEKVPLKYPGLDPWQIWTSESQERMTLAVPKTKWERFEKVMKKHGVDAWVIGEFTKSGRCVVSYEKKTVMDIAMEFLHDGLPKKQQKTVYKTVKNKEPQIAVSKDLTVAALAMLSRLNIASYDFIPTQFDHTVQGTNALMPLQGRGRVNADATVFRPVYGSQKAVLLSQGYAPWYSDIDTYHMAAASLDTAVCNAVTAGASLEKIAVLDNFCWCSSTDELRLGELKRAAKACYDVATFYQTPFISGKDSMFNDFSGFDQGGKPVKISVPPTLLISSLAVLPDVTKAVSLDAKMPGDLVYVLGETHDELGGSEYFAMHKGIGNSVPQVNLDKNKKLYEQYQKAVEQNLIASGKSIHRGGLFVALIKTAMGGRMGLAVSLKNLKTDCKRNDFALFSESLGRIVVTIAPSNKESFKKIMNGVALSLLGTVTESGFVNIAGLKDETIISTTIMGALEAYKKTFAGW